ncbi:MAG TPA: Asp-tRNA(Asn)/Glu-tRNA(Gln) amidotransferase GatCAB subunit B, partial [Desulfobacterales bacterium]|nr:Asp-tRNA(Asn)/Glu-tRNA(Gln) amidotransferase GatCAB subunit B [Desulfobacterales bacterium]
ILPKNPNKERTETTVFLEMLDSGKDAAVVVKEKNLVQVSDQGELLVIVQEIIAANPEQAADFKGGKTKLMGYFVGQLMQKTKGKANPKVANELFSKELSK